MYRKLDIACLAALACAFAAVAAFNIIQPDRATVSEAEQRTLAAMPEFSLRSLASGEYFTGVETFVSDTFVGREALVRLSQRAKVAAGAAGDLMHRSGGVVVLQAGNGAADTDIEIVVPEIDVPQTETAAPETSSPAEAVIETATPDTTSDAAAAETSSPDTAAAETTEPAIPGLTVKLSRSKLYITKGSYATLSASVDPFFEGATVSWTAKGAVTLTADGDRIRVTGNEAGEAKVTASCGGVSAVCDVIVAEDMTPGANGISNTIITNEPEFLTSGMFIYKDAVYSIPYLVEKNARAYMAMADYYASLWPHATLSVEVVPLASGMLDREQFGSRVTDQNNLIETINSYSTVVNGVNCFDEMWSHRDEYLFFKSDHHWTARGAYYAYVAFAKSVGLDPVPITELEEVCLNDAWQGTMYKYSGDERVLSIYDAVYAYLPRKAHTMTIYGATGGKSVYQSSIVQSSKSYGAFIAGDNAYTIINVPENPQDMNVLVFKDSFGNAFVPYLCEHYGNIIVVDPRHVTFNVYEQLKDYPLRDIVFLTNATNPSVASWTLNMLRSVGK